MHTKLYVALQRLELRAMVCGSPPSLSAAAPPTNLASSAWAFDRLNAPRHKPKQSISIVLREHIIGFNFFNFWKKNTIIANLHKPLQ